MMTQNKPKGVIEHKQLFIISIGDIKPVGEHGAMKLTLKAKGNDGELTYFTFNKDLFEILKSSEAKDLDCEVETSSREHEGNTYTDRKIIQVYVNGEPVGKRKAGGGFRGDSPEQRASIEAQSAFKMITELIVHDKLSMDHPLGKNLLSWLERKSSTALSESVSSIKTPANTQAESKPLSAQKRHFANAGEFLTACKNELHVNRSDVLIALSLATIDQIKNFDEAWEKLNGRG